MDGDDSDITEDECSIDTGTASCQEGPTVTPLLTRERELRRTKQVEGRRALH